MARDELPQRRASETFDFPFVSPDGAAIIATVTVTLGFYDDGRVGEAFLNGPKLGSALEAAARDIGVLTSICLQYGATPKIIRKALTENADGMPIGLAGQLAEILIAEGGRSHAETA